ncbi:MAG: PAS domain-containing protein [Syntrophobacterales bacterium]|nr:PAS domain-containing protein [Syntrophobacterales bacterium]
MAHLVEKIGFPRLLKFLGILVVVLLAVAFILGLLSLRRTQEIIANDFQEQQLILARTAARKIEDDLAFLRRELRILAFSPAIQYLETPAWANRMQVSFDELARLGVTAILRLSQDGQRAYMLDAQGSRVVKEDFTATPQYCWAQEPVNKGRIYHGPVEVDQQGAFRVPVMIMATPIYLESVDEAHPRAPGGLGGVLVFKIDLSAFLASSCGTIRSGRTGYCWVIDQQGLFLYHPERDFIGDDAFTARGRRNPAISFDKINEIQKARMLQGEDGTARYISGWHRGVIQRMEKFVAFTHAHVDTEGPRYYPHVDPVGTRIWAVAVVAPTEEVAGTISSLYIRQFLIQGLLIFSLLGVAVVIFYHERRWTMSLQEEVERATARLKKSEERYRSVVERSPDFIFMVDSQGLIRAANTATARAFNMPAIGLQGRSLYEFFAPDDAKTILDQVHYVFTTGRNVEHKGQMHIQGRPYWLSSHFVPLYGEDGRTVERVLIFARDITDRHLMEEQMARTEKLASIGTLASGVAHEINNPLGIILGFTEMLLDMTPRDSRQYEMLKTIERQGLNCKRIVENLMSFARTPAKPEESCDLNQELENLLKLVQNTLMVKKVELETHFTPNLPRVRGDAGELQQVFLNLITNAIAAMPEGGRLTLRTRLHPTGRVEAVVADTGTGIPREYVDRIFDPFFTTKQQGEGTGLGLSVAHAIVEKYGGTIRFETKTAQDPGGGPTGTTFYVTLPPA